MKENIYRTLISQLEETEKLGYNFESAWISYVLLEDRLLSILRSSGGEHLPNGNEIKMMGPKIGQIKIRLATNEILKGHLEVANLIPRIEDWKDKRNVLMHSMANGSMSIEQIENDIANLAKDGTSLVRDFASAARRIKKHNK